MIGLRSNTCEGGEITLRFNECHKLRTPDQAARTRDQATTVFTAAIGRSGRCVKQRERAIIPFFGHARNPERNNTTSPRRSCKESMLMTIHHGKCFCGAVEIEV